MNLFRLICRVVCVSLPAGILSMGFLDMPAAAQSVSIRGTIRDRISFAGLAGVRVDIVNKENPADRAVVFTDGTGQWQYSVQPAVVRPVPLLPKGISLGQNYPNPFNPSTVLPFSIDRAGPVRLVVYNTLGQLLDAVALDLPAGGFEIPWSSRGSAGVLFVVLEAAGERTVRKMIQLDAGGRGGWGEVRLVNARGSSAVAPRASATEYMVTGSLLGYEPDSVSVPLINGAVGDLALETVHSRAWVVDLHNDVLELAASGYQLGTRHTTNHSDLPRFADGGVDAQMFSIYINPNRPAAQYYQLANAMLDSFQAQIARNPSRLVHARTPAEVNAANTAGALAGMLCVEGGHVLQDDIGNLKALYARGVRAMTLTWNNSTSWAVSAQDARSTTTGLSELGKQIVRTMDTLGMIIDVSHVGVKTVEDVLSTTTHPIIASHSGARALNNHYRNLSDDQIRAIAQRGGVIGIVFYPPFLSATSPVTLETVIRHMDYIKNLVGIDYVALGSDFDGIGTNTVVGLEDVTHFPDLTRALLMHGYTRDEVRKILGENFRRVFNAVCQ